MMMMMIGCEISETYVRFKTRMPLGDLVDH